MILRSRKIVEMEGNNYSNEGINVNVASQSVDSVEVENREDVNMPGNVNETRNVEIGESLRNVNSVGETRNSAENVGTMEAFMSLIMNQLTELKNKMENSNKEIENKVAQTVGTLRNSNKAIEKK